MSLSLPTILKPFGLWKVTTWSCAMVDCFSLMASAATVQAVLLSWGGVRWLRCLFWITLQGPACLWLSINVSIESSIRQAAGYSNQDAATPGLRPPADGTSVYMIWDL